MKLRKGELIELTIEKMAYGAHGIGRIDDFVVFVRSAVPGDRITARIYKKKRAYAEAEIVELITPSPDREKPLCPFIGYCGGCQWQQIRYEKQLQYKREQVKESLEHIGGLKDVPVLDTIPSEDIFAYRNKMEFSFSDRRWFLPEELDRRELEGNFALGLHVPGTYNKVIDMDGCLLQKETGNDILKEIKRYVKNCGVPVYGLKSHKGFWRFVTIRYSRAFDEWMVNLVTSENRQEITRPLAEILCDRIKNISTVVNNIHPGKAAIAVGEREVIISGKGYIKDSIGRFTFQVSANSFFQTNFLTAENLYQIISDYAELTGAEDVLDLYSGTGTIPIFLSNMAGTVTGMEISKSAVLDARRNCEDNGIDNCRFISGDVREAFPLISNPPDLLIIDPPRAGMHKDVLARVMALSPDNIIYISCNPATMGRDIGHMIQDYELIEIQPVDMFPHTYHIEAIAKLCLRK